jgi:tRNA U34 5-methylaminomethyl-2-thiouridine-forming methyltransferase MnmC
MDGLPVKETPEIISQMRKLDLLSIFENKFQPNKLHRYLNRSGERPIIGDLLYQQAFEHTEMQTSISRQAFARSCMSSEEARAAPVPCIATIFG